MNLLNSSKLFLRRNSPTILTFLGAAGVVATSIAAAKATPKAMALLEKELVAVVPCSGFGIKNFVRWSYAASMENIEKGLDRLEKFINE